MRQPVLSLTAILIGLGSVAVFATAGALAHSRPIRLDPAPGAVLQSAPTQVQGWFTADIRRDPNWSFLRVADGQGNRADEGETQLSSDRRHMSVNLRAGLGPGRYTVTWRTYDEADGAIFGDCYTFFVGQAAADEAIAANLRLDGGRDCERIDLSAREGTPAPGRTPAAAATQAPGEGNEHAPEGGDAAGEYGGEDIPIWGLVIGIAGAFVVGAVVGRLAGRS